MRLVNAAVVIKKSIYIFFGLILLFYTFTEIVPQVYRQIVPETPKENPIKFKFNPIVFSSVKEYPTGENGIDFSNSKIVYRRSPETDWENLNKKTSKIYTYRTNLPEDIDYLITAKGIAFNIGYTDLNLISTGESDRKYIWEVPQDKIQLIINGKTKKMEQKIGSLTTLKSYLTAGEFVNSEFPNNFVRKLLLDSKNYTSEEIQKSQLETTFLRFEGSNLIESQILGSELAFVKIYLPLDGKKIVGNNYEVPNNFAYIGSLRPEIAQSKKNYRYPRFNLYKNDIKEAFDGEQFDLSPLPDVVSRVVNSKDFVVRGIVFNELPHGTPVTKSTKIENISLENYEIAYFDDFQDGFGKNNLIQPIYIFRGNFDTSTGQRGKIILYTPAVDPKYYN